MHTIKINNNQTELKFYDHPNELPIIRYFEFQYYLSIAFATDFQNVIHMINSVETCLVEGNNEDARKLLFNMKVTFASSFNKVDSMLLALGQLLYSIDNQEFNPINQEETIKQTFIELGEKGLTKEHLNQVLDTVKKKFVPN